MTGRVHTLLCILCLLWGNVYITEGINQREDLPCNQVCEDIISTTIPITRTPTNTKTITKIKTTPTMTKTTPTMTKTAPAMTKTTPTMTKTTPTMTKTTPTMTKTTPTMTKTTPVTTKTTTTTTKTTPTTTKTTTTTKKTIPTTTKTTTTTTKTTPTTTKTTTTTTKTTSTTTKTTPMTITPTNTSNARNSKLRSPKLRGAAIISSTTHPLPDSTTAKTNLTHTTKMLATASPILNTTAYKECIKQCINRKSTTVKPQALPTGYPSQALPTGYPSQALPTGYPSQELHWEHVNVSVLLQVFVNGTFTNDLNNHSSNTFNKYANGFRTSLTNWYSTTIDGFIMVEIEQFFSGSIGCNYAVVIKGNRTDPLNKIPIRQLRSTKLKPFINLDNGNNLTVNVNKTEEKQKILLDNESKRLENPCSFFRSQCGQEFICVKHGSEPKCTHKCNVKNVCSKNGECYVDTSGTVKCRCREDSTYLYKGDTCEDKVLVFFSGRNTAIIGGTAGAVIAVLLLLFIYIGAKWRHRRAAKSKDEKLSDPEELQRENSRIENVPLDGVGRSNPSYHHDMGSQKVARPNDYTDLPSDTRGHVYQEIPYSDGRSYRVLEDPNIGSNPLIYQPTTAPPQRTSTASKFDDLDLKPLSHHMKPEVDREPFHAMINTEHPYAIRRPQVLRTTVNSDGYR